MLLMNVDRKLTLAIDMVGGWNSLDLPPIFNVRYDSRKCDFWTTLLNVPAVAH
jgi:hypothetical protein